MGLRLLIYAQDTRGLGHVRRCGLIAREILREAPDASVLMVTKSGWASQLRLGERFDVVKLPGQLTVGETVGEARAAERRRIRDMRAALIRDAVEHMAPHLVLIDNEPLGYQGELALAMERLSPRTRLVFGLRDVVDEPSQTLERWQRLGVMDALEKRYDDVLVYGHPDVTDTLEAYGFSSAVRSKATFTGYVCRNPAEDVSPDAARDAIGAHDGRPVVVVTGGGGHDAGAVLMAALEAAESIDAEPLLLLVTGPFMPAEIRGAIRERALARGHRVRREVDLLSAMAAARAVVSMGGYNTTAEAVALGRRPIVFPRHLDKSEQLIRARAFDRLGLAHCIEPDGDVVAQITAALRTELAPPADNAHRGLEYLDLGARRTARLILDSVGR
jgi:predicted glycosyltransferase